MRRVDCFLPRMEPTVQAQEGAKSQVEALFDSLALEYVREREQQFSFVCQKRIAVELLGRAKGRLLEVGCGPAVMTPELVAMGFLVHGIDVSTEMVRRARQRMAGHPLEKRCSFALGDVERLHEADASYDAVLCMGVLEYLPRYSAALAEIARVLKPGGTVVITLPNRASPYHVAASAYRRLRGGRRRQLPHNRCVPWMFDAELAAAGLRKLESRACNFIFFPLQELLPRASLAVNRALLPLSRTAVAPFLGAQYIVAAQKTPWRYG